MRPAFLFHFYRYFPVKRGADVHSADLHHTGSRAAETLHTSITAFMHQKQNRHENIFMSRFLFFSCLFLSQWNWNTLCFSITTCWRCALPALTGRGPRARQVSFLTFAENLCVCLVFFLCCRFFCALNILVPTVTSCVRRSLPVSNSSVPGSDRSGSGATDGAGQNRTSLSWRFIQCWRSQCQAVGGASSVWGRGQTTAAVQWELIRFQH